MENAVRKVRISREDESCLFGLYRKGKLGRPPVAEDRLKAGIRFMSDYGASVFSQRTTTNYERLFVPSGGRGPYDPSERRYDAADRYLRALKAVAPYGVYALHFLRDEKNVAAFLAKYPVLLSGNRRTYKAVYLSINRMLDKLSAFYDSDGEKSV